MINILYIVSTLRNTGPIIVLENTIKYLDRNKFKPIVLTLSKEPNDSLKRYFIKELNTEVKSLNLSRLEGFFLAKNQIKIFIKNNNINLVHTHGLRADIIIQHLSIPFISTIHNYPHYDYPLRHGKIKGGLMANKHLNFIKNNPKNCIACSKSISDEFKQNSLNLDYIQNGVDTTKFYPIEEKKKNELKKYLKIKQAENIFISTGALITRKDMKTVIQGFIKFNKNKKNILLIAGDGHQRKELENIADTNIIFLGNVSNIAQYLQVSDCFISSSLAEGLPNSVLEAMACGLPTLLSDIPSNKEIYHNKSDFFFKTKNIDQLANKLDLIVNNFKNLSNLSLQIILKNFSAEIMSKNYQKIYRNFYKYNLLYILLQ